MWGWGNGRYRYKKMVTKGLRLGCQPFSTGTLPRYTNQYDFELHIR
jgi:hypothetical protein